MIVAILAALAPTLVLLLGLSGLISAAETSMTAASRGRSTFQRPLGSVKTWPSRSDRRSSRGSRPVRAATSSRNDSRAKTFGG